MTALMGSASTARLDRISHKQARTKPRPHRRARLVKRRKAKTETAKVKSETAKVKTTRARVKAAPGRAKRPTAPRRKRRTLACQKCGEHNPPLTRICGQCGNQVAAARHRRYERRARLAKGGSVFAVILVFFLVKAILRLALHS